MTSILTRGTGLLRRSFAALQGLASLAGVASDLGTKGSVASPHIRRALEDHRGRIPQNTGAVPASAGRTQALAYHVRPHFVACQVRPGFDALDVPPITRFHVVSADPALLACLGKATAGFHVFELSCAGLERLWRDDLAKVLETRGPLAGRLAVLVDSGHAELEHVALPVLSAGRVVAVRGWFDQIDGTGVSMRQIEWTGIRHVRRAERARSLSLPARLMRPQHAGMESEMQRRVDLAEAPGRPFRSSTLRAVAGDNDEPESPCQPRRERADLGVERRERLEGD